MLLGYRSASGETIVGAKRAVLRTRTAQRKPEEKRWSPENLEMVGGTPWRTTPGQDKEGDEVLMPDAVVCVEVADAEKIERPEARRADVVPRRVTSGERSSRSTGMPKGAKGARP